MENKSAGIEQEVSREYSNKEVSKTFGSFDALKDINLDIKTGELVALLGPSGSGKTSLLRIIAGLEEADHGVVLFGEGGYDPYSHDRKKSRLRLSALCTV